MTDTKADVGRQSLLFGAESSEDEIVYTKKIQSPVYEIKGEKPHLLALFDPTKTAKLIEKIMASSVSAEEKIFLVAAASRHTVFHYENIAEYYAHAERESFSF